MKRVCKDCIAEISAIPNISENRIRILAQRRPAPAPGPRCITHWRVEKKRRSLVASEKYVEKVYGLPAEDYNLLFIAQGGRCYICRRGSKKRLSVDHDHDLGCGHPPDQGCRDCVRCLLCDWCNHQLLGRSHMDSDALRRAAEVLDDPPARKVLAASNTLLTQ